MTLSPGTRAGTPSSIVNRYLTRHAELPKPIPRQIRGRYQHVLTVPAFDEPDDFVERLLADVRQEGLLCIITVNVPDDAKPAAVSRTRSLAAALRKHADLLIIDRVENPIPHRQGVGLARKLAADLACALISEGIVDCPLIFMTDADVVLPADYFGAAAEYTGPGTIVYPFAHHASRADLQEAVDVYELHLRHYVDGLSQAGSGYAHQCLGSTLAIHAETYAGVRGVPLRNGAEDFYLLNKAAKVAPVVNLAEPRLVIQGRPSQRVPFGTGPAITAMPQDLEQYLSYPPAAFDDLARVLRYLAAWSLFDALPDLPEELLQALEALGWSRGKFDRQHPPGARRLRAVFEWFDGFRSMRLVRARGQALAATPLLATLRHQWQCPNASPTELLQLFREAEQTRVTGLAEAVKTHATLTL